MLNYRTYKDQFEAQDIEKIEFIFFLLNDIKKKKNFLNFYCQELRCCLIGGSIFGGLLITFSILEMFMLEANASTTLSSNNIWTLEEDKAHINASLNNLSKLGLIETYDAERLKTIYREYRIPFVHGLRTKGIYYFAGTHNFFGKLIDPDSTPSPVESKDMEEIIEKYGLNLIAEMLVIIAKIK